MSSSFFDNFDSLVFYGAGAGLFGFLIGGCAVGAVELAQKDASVVSEPRPTISIPACGEEDVTARPVVELPINVSNEDIGSYVCYVRVIEDGQQKRSDPDNRIQFRLRD